MGIGESGVMRVLRIAGIIAFALIIGYATNSLYKMYEVGSLFESYNSQRAEDRSIGYFLLVHGGAGLHRSDGFAQ